MRGSMMMVRPAMTRRLSTAVILALLCPVPARAQSWTAPRTWTTGEFVTAAIMNTHVRDNLTVLRAGGIAVTTQAAGDVICASSSSQLGRVAGVATGSVLVSAGVTTCPGYSTSLTLSGAGIVLSNAAPATGLLADGAVGSNLQLRANGSIILKVDDNNDAAEDFIFRNGANVTLVDIDETARVGINQAVGTGQLSITAATDRQALFLTGVINTAAGHILGAATSGQSLGLSINAGTTAADWALNISNQTAGTNFLKIKGDGTITERGRAAGIGNWTNIAYAAGNFTCTGGGTWTVDSADQLLYAYTEIGDSVIVEFTIANTTTSACGAELEIHGLPVAAASALYTGQAAIDPNLDGAWVITGNATNCSTTCLRISREGLVAHPDATNTKTVRGFIVYNR